jgi:hypothetical protein
VRIKWWYFDFTVIVIVYFVIVVVIVVARVGAHFGGCIDSVPNQGAFRFSTIPFRLVLTTVAAPFSAT